MTHIIVRFSYYRILVYRKYQCESLCTTVQCRRIRTLSTKAGWLVGGKEGTQLVAVHLTRTHSHSLSEYPSIQTNQPNQPTHHTAHHHHDDDDADDDDDDDDNKYSVDDFSLVFSWTRGLEAQLQHWMENGSLVRVVVVAKL